MVNFFSLESENNCMYILMVESKGNRQKKVIIKKEWLRGGWGKSQDGTRSLNKWGVCRRQRMRDICVTGEGRRGRGERTLHNLPAFIWKNFRALLGEVSLVRRKPCEVGAWAVSGAGVGRMGQEAEGHVPQLALSCPSHTFQREGGCWRGEGRKEQVVSLKKDPVGSLSVEYWQPEKGMTEGLDAARVGKKLKTPTFGNGTPPKEKVSTA